MCVYFYIGFINFIIAGKILTNLTDIFSPNDFKKKRWYNLELFLWLIFKMGEANIMYPNLSPNTSDDQQFILNKIN